MRTRKSDSKQGKRLSGAASKLTFKIEISPIPMTQAAREASEDLLARMVARAIWDEYQEESKEEADDKKSEK
jgi:hypothetical protein